MPGGRRKNNHPTLWAFLTILTFPIVLISADILDVRGALPFIFAIVATLLILTMEVAATGKLWMFEDKFINRIGDPEMHVRLLIFVGAMLLVFESALILLTATDRRMDPLLLQMIVNKQCSAPRGLDDEQNLCRDLLKDKP
ncbi:MAG: hypothetical protein AAB386_00610 [Patescibacteria group bacterium]